MFFVVLLALLVAPFVTYSQDSTRYFFYKQRIDYGSIGLSNPISVTVQNGLEMLAYHDPTNLRTFNYSFSAGLVWDELTDPLGTIRNYGTTQFFNDEFFPFDPSTANGSVIPNITLHMLGGGFTFAFLEEYYRYHGIKHPVLAAIGTAYVKNLLNELVETPPYNMTRVDAVSDLYFWDIAGIVLFSQESVKVFFSEKIGLYNWGTMPVLSSRTEFRNTNAYYAFRPVRSDWNVKPIAIAGLGFLGGVSIPVSEKHTFSIAGGILSHQIVFGPENSNVAPELRTRPALGFFIDRENSVLASLLLKNAADGAVRLNVYPGVMKNKLKNAGFYAEAGRTVHAGIVWRIPGLGVGW